MSAVHPVLARLAAAGHAVRVDVQLYKGAGARSHRRGWYSCEVRVDPPLPRSTATKTPGWNVATGLSQRFVTLEPTAEGARNEALTRLQLAVEWVVNEQVGVAVDAEAEAERLRERAAAARALAVKYRRPDSPAPE